MQRAFAFRPGVERHRAGLPNGAGMKLRDLDGHFLKLCPDKRSMDRVEALADADGVMFQCPQCAQGKETGKREDGLGFARGAHYVICCFVGKVAEAVEPKPGPWNPSGTGLDDLSFVGPRAASVLITTGCRWHGFIRNGEATL